MPGDEIEAITESAKAVQEAAKFGGKALDIGRDAGGWIDRIFGRGIEDAVALHWSDRARARRIEAAIYDWERLTELFRKVNARLSKKEGISSLRLMPPKIVLALLENATVEYEDDLHTLWANLLATGLDASADEVQRQFVSILSDLSSNDAKLLRELHSEFQTSGEPVWFYGRGNLIIEKTRERSVSDEVSLINLNRLGLVAPSTLEFQTYEPIYDSTRREYHHERETVVAQGPLAEITITPLGIAFCKAVISE